VLKHFFLNII